MKRDGVHLAGPAGPVSQVCARCGVELVDGVPTLEGRSFTFGRHGPVRLDAPMFFTPGLSVAVRGGGAWITDEPPDCEP